MRRVSDVVSYILNDGVVLVSSTHQLVVKTCSPCVDVSRAVLQFSVRMQVVARGSCVYSSSFECGAVSLGVPVLCADINFPCDTCFLLGLLCYHRRHSSVGRFPSVFNVSGWTSISRATRALRSLCFPPSSIVCEAHPFGVPFLWADTISILHGCFSSSYTRSVGIDFYGCGYLGHRTTPQILSGFREVTIVLR